ncbi:hypothetical protein [Desulfonatronovibrio hydrogenovorans]|uniref:hypothetical protein n=1 Tax=Desulfonatronovibrio hydrogenovorans TaxID=53245 RepID=UPI00048BBB0A|nr:hypothetical protein [Desulfonatronovibrio hydrogenovorans]
MDNRLIIFDANVMSPIYNVSPDKACSLLDWIVEYNNCMVSRKQYLESPCNHYKCLCKILEDEHDFSKEDVLDFFYNKASNMMRILNDFTDGKIVYFAFQEGALVVSCDKDLLQACRMCSIDRLCFKAFMISLHDKCSIIELHGDGFNFELLFDQNATNPFHSFYKNSRCKLCCGEECNAIKIGQKLKQIIC